MTRGIELLFRNMIIIPIACVLWGYFSSAASAGADPCDFTLSIPISLIDADVAVFGELHGTKEAPFLFLSAVCEGLRRSVEKTVYVGLEYPQVESDHLLRYINSAGSVQEQEQFLETDFWRRKTQDGRTSVAMFELIDSLRQLREGTDRVEVFAIVPEAGSGRHEQFMAAAIDKSVKQNRGSPHFVLVGNLHSRRKTWQSGETEIRPMLLWLEAETIAVNIFSRHGDYWACTIEGCGLRSLAGEPGEFGTLRTARPKIDSSSHHDHSVVFDRFTASPPAYSPESRIDN